MGDCPNCGALVADNERLRAALEAIEGESAYWATRIARDALGRCAGCGGRAEGFATITIDEVERRYCHDGPSPTCYERASQAM